MYTAADAAKAAEMSLEDGPLRSVENAGESLEQMSQAYVEEVGRGRLADRPERLPAAAATHCGNPLEPGSKISLLRAHSCPWQRNCVIVRDGFGG